MTSTAEALQRLQKQETPAFFLDFVRWVGPRLEETSNPEEFLYRYQLALAELAEGRPGLHGSLVARPPRFYVALTVAAGFVAAAFGGPEFGFKVDRARLDLSKLT